MKILNVEGDYDYQSGTRTPKESNHPIHQARIEIALGQGEWLFAPTRGHQLNKYKNVDQTPSKQEAFKKELLLYLEKYSPEVRESFGDRGLVDMSLTIKEDALDV